MGVGIFKAIDLSRIRTNAYLLLGRPPAVEVTELKRMLRSMRFDPNQQRLQCSNGYEINFNQLLDAVEKRLDDPYELWVDEFFCPWQSIGRDAHSRSVSDRVFFAKEALDVNPKDPVLLHDFSVANILEASVLEENPRFRDERWSRKRETAWRDAITGWISFCGEESFWAEYVSRILAKCDPRLNIFTKDDVIRDIITLPLMVLSKLKLNHLLAHGKIGIECIDENIQLLGKKLPRCNHDIVHPWLYVLDPLTKKHDLLLRSLKEKIIAFQDDPNLDNMAIDDVFDHVMRHFEILKSFNVFDDPCGKQLLDSIICQMRELMIMHGNATGDWHTHEDVFSHIIAHTSGPDLKRRISEDIVLIREIRLKQSRDESQKRLFDITGDVIKVSGTSEGDVIELIQNRIEEGLEEKYFLENPKIGNYKEYELACDDLSNAVLGFILGFIKQKPINPALISMANRCRDMAVSEIARDKAQRVVNQLRAELNQA